MMIKAILYGLLLVKLTIAQEDDFFSKVTDPTVKLTIELAKSWRQSHPYQDFTVTPEPDKKGYFRIALKSSKNMLTYKDARISENTITLEQAKQIYIYFRDENYQHMILPQQAIITDIFNQNQIKSWPYWCNIL